MTTRVDRIEARVEHGRAERIRYAAKLSHTSVSSFVVDAAAERAEQVIANERVTVFPADFFDAILRELDEPGKVIPALRQASRRARTLKHP